MKSAARILAIAGFTAAIGLAGIVTARAADQTLLNVSYDPTRELYQQYNEVFAKHWTSLIRLQNDSRIGKYCRAYG